MLMSVGECRWLLLTGDACGECGECDEYQWVLMNAEECWWMSMNVDEWGTIDWGMCFLAEIVECAKGKN